MISSNQDINMFLFGAYHVPWRWKTHVYCGNQNGIVPAESEASSCVS